MEIPQEKVEQLFVDLVSSPVIREIGKLIKTRLNRDLLPFDIWYDGFKNRSTIDGEKLNAITKSKYSTPEDFAAVGQFYRNFDQVSDREVKEILENYKS